MDQFWVPKQGRAPFYNFLGVNRGWDFVVFNLQGLSFPKQCLNCTSDLYLLFTVQLKFENQKCHFLPRVLIGEDQLDRAIDNANVTF